MSDAATLSTWMDAYLRAWNSNQPVDIAALFGPDARYFTAPFDQPWIGTEAIVRGWLGRKDEQGDFEFEWEPVAITPDVQVVRARTRYPTFVVSNLWLIRLDPDGKCQEFTEYWMEHPKS